MLTSRGCVFDSGIETGVQPDLALVKPPRLCRECGYILSKRQRYKDTGMCKKCYIENIRVPKDLIGAGVSMGAALATLGPGVFPGEERRFSILRCNRGYLYRFIWVQCPECKESRWVQKQYTARPNFSNYCRKCYRTVKCGAITVEQRTTHKDSCGYWQVVLPVGHWCVPMARKPTRTISVHRLVMAIHLGRLLASEEYIHHVNGDRTDNRIENLCITTKKEHPVTYAAGYRQGFKDGSASLFAELKEQNQKLLEEVRLLHLKIKIDEGTL
jgi:hypothetical protein